MSDLESSIRRSSLDSLDPPIIVSLRPQTHTTSAVKFADKQQQQQHYATGLLHHPFSSSSARPPFPKSSSASTSSSTSSPPPPRASSETSSTAARDLSSFRDLCCLCPRFSVSISRAYTRVSSLIVLFAVLNVCMSTYYAWLDSNQSSYGTDDWQSCVLYGEAPASTGYNTRFSLAAASAGQQTVIFSMIAAGTVYRALHHPEWLVSTLAVVAYALVGCLCFFSFSPAIPFPTNLTANVLILMVFVRPDMYDQVRLEDAAAAAVTTMTTMTSTMQTQTQGLRDDDPSSVVDDDPYAVNDDAGGAANNPCLSAYRYNQAFLYLQYATIFCVGLLFLLGLLAEIQAAQTRDHNERDDELRRLVGRRRERRNRQRRLRRDVLLH